MGKSLGQSSFTRKNVPPNFYPPPPPPTISKQQFSCYNPIKTSFVAAVVVPVPFPFKFNIGHTNFGFTDVQYLQNGVFSIENSLNGQNHSLIDFYHAIKKSLTSPKFPIPPLRDIPPYLSNAIWETFAFFTFQSRGPEKIFTYFLSFTVNWDSV